MSALQASISLNIPALVAFASIVGVWAFFLPINVRDVDNRRLPPNPTARILFIFLSLMLYLVLVGALKLSGDAFEHVGNEMFQAAMKLFKGQEPLMAVTLLAGLRTVPLFRELENNLIIWLHSARHLNADAVTLTSHLQDCSFEPTPGEQQKNINNLREFDVYVTDTKANVLHLEAVNAWRKTSSLLRALRDWNDSKESVLNREDLKVLEQLEKAHRRKTRLAMDIIRMLELVERGGMPGSAMGEVAGQLASASHKDRAEIANMENRLQEVLPGQGEQHREPMRITYSELQQYLSQIEGYFRVEYRYLLQQAADLSAKSIVFAGEDAPRRLDYLKTIGFGQLGRIERINFDRILWVFFAISLGGFLIMFLWPRTQSPTRFQISPDLLARIALVTALASLVGSVVGSSRKLQSRPITPWTHYLIAGLVAACMFVLVHGTAVMLSALRADPAAAETASAAPPFLNMLPWAASPFYLAIAICWLARMPKWPGAPGANLERVFDGLAICAVMLLAQATATSLHLAFKTSFVPMLEQRIAESGGLLYHLFKPNPTLLLGFFVGVVVIKDVRRAAHSQLTDLEALRAYTQAEEAIKPLFSEDSVGVRLKPRLAASG
ncbi:MAG: hypothetical protein AB7S70_07040 [Hyphomicrobium sp.]|uniref:hypothetical protein n=1 Tax=Hyphomicrobium sp. TaxID=82 RepID=UPI003D10B903